MIAGEVGYAASYAQSVLKSHAAFPVPIIPTPLQMICTSCELFFHDRALSSTTHRAFSSKKHGLLAHRRNRGITGLHVHARMHNSIGQRSQTLPLGSLGTGSIMDAEHQLLPNPEVRLNKYAMCCIVIPTLAFSPDEKWAFSSDEHLALSLSKFRRHVKIVCIRSGRRDECPHRQEAERRADEDRQEERTRARGGGTRPKCDFIKNQNAFSIFLKGF